MPTTLHVPAQRPAPTAPAVEPGAQGPVQVHPGPADVEQGWGQVLRVGAARAVLSMLVSLLIWSLLPAVIGWTPRVILSGSMEPRIHVGDVIVTREVPTATPGQGPGPHRQGPRPPRHHAHAPDGASRRRRLDRHARRRQPPGRLLARLRRRGARHGRHPGPVRRPPDVLGRRAQLARPGRHGRPARHLPLRGVPGQAEARGRHGLRLRLRLRLAGRSGRGRRVAAAVTIGVVAAGALAGPAEAAFRKSVGNNTSFAAASTFYPYRTAVAGGLAVVLLAPGRDQRHRDRPTPGPAPAPGPCSPRPYPQAQAGALPSEPRDTSLSVTSASDHRERVGHRPGRLQRRGLDQDDLHDRRPDPGLR